MPDKRWKAEGVVTTHFEIEVDAFAFGYENQDDAESEIENLIEEDPADFFYKGRDGVNITYREDRVEMTRCVQMEPDWAEELTKIIVSAERDALNRVIKSLPDEAKKTIVLALTGEDDEDED
jgi:hypothetical protein